MPENPPKESRAGILGVIDTRLKLLALIVLVTEPVLIGIGVKTESLVLPVVGIGLLALIIVGLFCESYLMASSKTRAASAETLRSDVRRLKEVLDGDGFRPDLIVGVARNGLLVAAYLSHEYGKLSDIPTITLWPRPNYENEFNKWILRPRFITPGRSDECKILIVDDLCFSGKALSDAKNYVSKNIEESLDVRVRIETAAVRRVGGPELVGVHGPTYSVGKVSARQALTYLGDEEPD
jgi:hypoxanthine phosphoribosyltransferase